MSPIWSGEHKLNGPDHGNSIWSPQLYEPSEELLVKEIKKNMYTPYLWTMQYAKEKNGAYHKTFQINI